MNLRSSALGRGRASAIGTAIALAIVVVASAVFVVTRTVNAAGSGAPGKPIPAEYASAIVEGGTSCAALGSARLAAQLMDASGFSPTATNSRGGRGLAGLTVDQWNTWKPWPTATRTDGRANILALSHMTCDLVGHLRVDGITGDPWQLALAAIFTSTSAVTSAHGIPTAAQAEVNQTVAYAAYYGGQAAPSGSASVSPSDSASPSVGSLGPSASPSVSTSGPPPVAVAPSPQPANPTTQAPPVTKPTPTGPLTDGQLYNAEMHGCLSAAAGTDGTQLVVAGCNGSQVQHWTVYPDGTIRAVSLCMDLAWGSAADWTKVQVAYCSGNPAQKWHLNAKKQITISILDAATNRTVTKCLNRDNNVGVVSFGCLDQGNQWFVFQPQA